MSGPPPKSSKSESLTPSNAHLNKKGIEISTTTQPVATTSDEDPLFPLVMNQQVLD